MVDIPCDKRFQIGDLVGFFKVVSEGYKRPELHNRVYYDVECLACDLKVIKSVRYDHLANGTTISCGCIAHQMTAARNFKHGMAKRGEVEELFWRWCTMRQRCYDPNKTNYRWYGERGIKVCKEWEDDYLAFREWALANGFRPELEIDRRDPDGDYCPENCRWVTREENMKTIRPRS